MPKEFINDSDVLMTKLEIADYLRLTVSRIGYFRLHGILPEPIYLSPRSPRWRKSDINEMLDKMNTKFAPIACENRRKISKPALARASSKAVAAIGGDV